jgi:hypothetical protein
MELRVAPYFGIFSAFLCVSAVNLEQNRITAEVQTNHRYAELKLGYRETKAGLYARRAAVDTTARGVSVSRNSPAHASQSQTMM